MSQQMLSKPEVEDLFVQASISLHVDIILDGIDEMPERHGYRIRSHDSFGRVPDIEVEYADDIEPVLDRVSLTLEKLCMKQAY